MTTDTTTELRTRIASLEAELVAARPQWQPIETAPSDVEVLMYSPWAHATNPERIDLGIYHDTRGGSRHPWATHSSGTHRPLTGTAMPSVRIRTINCSGERMAPNVQAKGPP